MNPAPATNPPLPSVTLGQAMQALAIAGDLAMGQPIDHSARAARLAVRIARAAGAGDAACAHAHMVALLRWSGCTASAPGFAAALGDDVAGRRAMLAHTLPAAARRRLHKLAPLAEAQCEVAGDLAALLGLPAPVELALRNILERADASPAAPDLVWYATLAGDVEILARTHGPDAALAMLKRMAGTRYPAALVELAAAQFDALDAGDAPPAPGFLPVSVPLAVVADAVELKLPWLAGYARQVAQLALRAGEHAGLPDPQLQALARAALLHGLGRAAILNPVWERRAKLGTADWESVRLAPYWTARACARIPGLEGDALLASQVYERLDGSGYFRSLHDDALGLPQRLLAAAAAFVALRSRRPWRAAHDELAATTILDAQAAGGRFDRAAVAAVTEAARDIHPAPADARFSPREREVLKQVCRGASLREAARAMRISTGAVREHLEHILGQLGCASLPAATLKALERGLI